MGRQPQVTIPDHLSDLLVPTPSGTRRLLAAWDGLSTETQILILKQLGSTNLPPYLCDLVYVEALKNPNAYVRYLAARKFRFSETDADPGAKKIKQQIENDLDPLVKYSRLETTYVSNAPRKNGTVDPIFDPREFFSLPHEARLAKVRCLHGAGKEIAVLVTHALEHELQDGTVAEIELFELLSDYLGWGRIRDAYRNAADISNDWGKGFGLRRGDMVKENECLWELVPKVPEALSYVLITEIPTGPRLADEMHKQVLSQLTPKQTCWLLWRSDIELSEFRKKIFFEGGQELAGSDWEEPELRHAAVSHGFNLSYEEFGALLRPLVEGGPDLDTESETPPDVSRARKLLTVLAEDACDLQLALLRTLADLANIRAIPCSAGWPEEYFSRRVRQLEREGELSNEARDARLYCLARSVVPWPWEMGRKGTALRAEISFLADRIVVGDTWKTFMGFAEACPEWRECEQYLPDIADGPV